MVEGAANKCAKYLLFVFNVLFVLAAAALVIVGAVLQYHTSGPSKLAIFIIVIGGVSFIVSFFGCCGAIKENRCMLITFAVLLVVILLMCVVATIVGFIFRNKANEMADDMILSYIEDYANNSVIMKITDNLQKDHHCCGSSNYTDWSRNKFLNETHSVPDSCCRNETQRCGEGVLMSKDVSKIYTQGCLSYLEDQVKTGYLILAAISVAVALIMIMGVILSCCLAKAVGAGYNTV